MKKLVPRKRNSQAKVRDAKRRVQTNVRLGGRKAHSKSIELMHPSLRDLD